jgi:hypothetical protein
MLCKCVDKTVEILSAQSNCALEGVLTMSKMLEPYQLHYYYPYKFPLENY